MMQLGSPQDCSPTPPWANQNFAYDMASGDYPGMVREGLTMQARQADLGNGVRPVYAVQTLAPGVSVTPIAQSNIPQNVTMVMPRLIDQAQQVAPNPQPALTPADLLHPLPSIVSTAPVQLPEPCSGISEWVDKNPVMAVGVLGVLAYMVFGKERG